MDDRLATHVSKWMQTLVKPCTVELRCRSEIIDCVMIADDTSLESFAEDLIESATADAFSEGKTRVYELRGILADGQQYVCPLRIRRRVDKTADDLVGTLAKQVTELHELLRKASKEKHDMALQFAAAVARENERLVAENAKSASIRGEQLDRLESLRSKDLERKMAQDREEADKEMRERAVDTALPLLAAIGAKLTKGMLPAPDSRGLMLREIVRGLNETQIGTIEAILSPEQLTEFRDISMATLNGKNCVKEFTSFVQKLPSETIMGVLQVMNVGQQAALQELLQSDGTSH